MASDHFSLSLIKTNVEDFSKNTKLEISAAYPPQIDGKVHLSVPTLFIVARRSI